METLVSTFGTALQKSYHTDTPKDEQVQFK